MHVCMTLTCLMQEYLLLISHDGAELYNQIAIQMKKCLHECAIEMTTEMIKRPKNFLAL